MSSSGVSKRVAGRMVTTPKTKAKTVKVEAVKPPPPKAGANGVDTMDPVKPRDVKRKRSEFESDEDAAAAAREIRGDHKARKLQQGDVAVSTGELNLQLANGLAGAPARRLTREQRAEAGRSVQTVTSPDGQHTRSVQFYQPAVRGKTYEAVGLVFDPTRVTLGPPSSVEVMAGKRPAVKFSVAAAEEGSTTYTVLTAHAPYENNDGTASQYRTKLLEKGKAEGADVVMGDFNTYAKVHSKDARLRTPAHGYVQQDIMASSKADHPLDQIHLSGALHATTPMATTFDTFDGTGVTPLQKEEGSFTVGTWNLQGRVTAKPEQMVQLAAGLGVDALVLLEPPRMLQEKRTAGSREGLRKREVAAPKASDHKPIALRLPDRMDVDKSNDSA